MVEPDSLSSPLPQSPHILVVDDDSVIRAAACQILRDAGWQPHDAADGPSGLARFELVKPDLILLDLMMPGMDGFEVARRLRAHPAGARVPIVVLTGLDDTASIDAAFEVGATDFIAKPVNWSLLRHRLRFVLRAARTADDLARKEQRLIQAQRIALLGSWEWRLSDGVVRRSAQYETLFGYADGGMPEGMATVLEQVISADRAMVAEAYEHARQGQGYRLRYRIQRTDGSVRTLVENAEPDPGSGSPQQLLRGTTQDITEQAEAERRIRHLAYHDPLTALPNRQRFREQLGEAVVRAQRLHAGLGLLLIDLRRFHRVNESFGQNVGDRVLQTIAQRVLGRLQSLRRASTHGAWDSVARLGGDLFAVVLGPVEGPREVERCAELMRATLSDPIAVETVEVAVSVRVGYACLPHHAEDAESLLKCAELTVTQGKRMHEVGVLGYSESLREAVQARVQLERELRQALLGDELELYFQPVVDCGSGRVAFAEALLRWNHPQRGLVMPADFIALAEDSGLIVELGTWSLRRACQQMQRWSGRGPSAVAVNLSPVQFRHAGLLETVRAALAEAGLPPYRLELEVTENVLVDDAELTRSTLNALKKMGVRLMVDDFGTGYSSLAYLKRLPVDAIKIDRSFVAGLDNDPGDAAIVGTIISLARTLGLDVVAEGVETLSQSNQLGARGCRLMQGGHFGWPMRAEQLETWMSDTLAAYKA